MNLFFCLGLLITNFGISFIFMFLYWLFGYKICKSKQFRMKNIWHWPASSQHKFSAFKIVILTNAMSGAVYIISPNNTSIQKWYELLVHSLADYKNNLREYISYLVDISYLSIKFDFIVQNIEKYLKVRFVSGHLKGTPSPYSLKWIGADFFDKLAIFITCSHRTLMIS